MIKLRDFTFVKICREQSEIKHCMRTNVASTSAFPQGSPKFYELRSMLRTTATCNIYVQGQGLFQCFYLMKSSSSSLFDLSCLGWAIFIQFGRDFKSLLISSSFAQDALMTSFSSDWTIPLNTTNRKETLQDAAWLHEHFPSLLLEKDAMLISLINLTHYPAGGMTSTDRSPLWETSFLDSILGFFIVE